MTYLELATAILAMSEAQQQSAVTLWRFNAYQDEYHPVSRLLFAGEDNQVLDSGHPVLTDSLIVEVAQ